jgi:WD40 repeat protein
LSETSEILADINDAMQMSKDSVRFLSSGLFYVLDTDENGLIDGLEFLSMLAMVSGMFQHEIIEFVFSLYDFSNLACLSFDETVLAVKNTINGLLKISLIREDFFSNLSAPSDPLLEELVTKIFSPSQSEFGVTWNSKLEIRSLTMNSLQIPEVSMWVEHFNDHITPEEFGNLGIFSCRQDVLKLGAFDDLIKSSIGKFDRMQFIRQVNQTYQWKSQVALLTPTEYSNVHLSRTMPSSTLGIDWIYGLETSSLIRHICYTKHDEVIYSVGKFVLLYSPQTNLQRRMAFHDRDISALQISRERGLVCSGNLGANPSLFIWDVDALEICNHLILTGCTDVAEVCFSQDGSTVIAVDNGHTKTCVIWNWERNIIVFKDTISSTFVFSLAVLQKDKYAIAHDHHLTFWVASTQGFIKREGIWVKNKKREIITALICTSYGDNVIGGTINGSLVLFQGFCCVKHLTAHTAAVTAIVACGDGYLSGSKDSRIRMWSSILEPRFLFDVSKFSIYPSITSLSLSSDGSMILFSTIGGEIFEISALDGSDIRGGPIIQGNRFGEVNDLDTHPSKLEAVTVGSDRTLRVYDLNLKSQIKLANLGFEATCIVYSPLGDTIAVGASNSSPSDYKFAILSEESLSILHIARDNNSLVTVLKFSVDGEILAVGCADGAIYLYSIPDEYELVCKCSRHVRAICSIDFSKEGEWIRSNSVDGELHFFSGDDGTYQSNLASMRDIEWASHDCLYSWHSKGIHSTFLNPLDFVVTSSLSSGEASFLLAAGSSSGSVRLFAYPSIHDSSEFQHFQVHTSRVGKVKFTFDNSYFLSFGVKDRTVAQYKVNLAAIQERDSTQHPAFLDAFLLPVESKDYSSKVSSAVLSESALTKDTQQFEWDRFLVGRQNLNESRALSELPPVSLSLERVYGYEATYALNNIFQITDSEIFYTVGNLGVIFNRSNETQRIIQVTYVFKPIIVLLTIFIDSTI